MLCSLLYPKHTTKPGIVVDSAINIYPKIVDSAISIC